MALLKKFNDDYLKVHKAKEDLFWTTYMGTQSDHEAFEKAEKEFKAFISDPTHGVLIQEYLETHTVDPKELVGLKGWLAFFECHAITNPQAMDLQEKLIEAESKLFQNRACLKLYFTDKENKRQEASTRQLAENISANSSSKIRESSYEALRSLENWVLENGFIELIKLRNEFAKAQGHDNFFDYTVLKNERMTGDKLFKILDNYEEATRERNQMALSEFERKNGPEALKPYHFKFYMSGDTTQAMDPHLPFSKSLQRWLHSFNKLGIQYQGATLTLDLLNRAGKYENGFMHGPQPAFLDGSKWQPATINFTSNATPNQIGSGQDGLATLFHEGGHAAHFSNIRQNSPCFSQEFPPTSMAYAETQSMFCDSLITDADWLTLYGSNDQGEVLSEELIIENIRNKQPFFNYRERSILVVPYFERDLYTLKDEDLTVENIIARARHWEDSILGAASPRPLLAIPHLLGGDSAASYHGYLLANMAVYQTRSFFINRDGFLTDNSNIGPDLTQFYWACGNRNTHSETLENLTGEGFNPQYLADVGNTSLTESIDRAKALISKANSKSTPDYTDENLDIKAHIKIVHGNETIAENSEGNLKMCQDFEAYIIKNYPNKDA
jgi:oligoendopeptidase F